MAIRLKLGNYETVHSDPLGRGFIGYFPRMTEQGAWEAGRGVWKMAVEKAGRQRFALIVGEGSVRAVGEITAVTEHDTAIGKRVALEGSILEVGHSVRDACLGNPDPVVNGSQNPIGYCELPEEAAFLTRACGCGCGHTSVRDFLPGHDVRAIQARVREHFGGSPAEVHHLVGRCDGHRRGLAGQDPHGADGLMPAIDPRWPLRAELQTIDVGGPRMGSG